MYEREPFPWQSRLAQKVHDDGAWPLEIGVPTGLGKTACLDIAVWWLASQAHLEPTQRTAPTRIWWCVNRRLLVDSTAKHARRLTCLLREGDSSAHDHAAQRALCSVRDRLCALSALPEAPPLQVVQLRGGMSSERPRDPSQPAIVLSTIPMYGSRLLFRGYGSSRSMRPIDAAMAGTDSLVLIDEAHLAQHLRDLVPALKDCAPRVEELWTSGRSGPQIVSLTATGDVGDGRFDLDEADREHPEVRRRLHARKPLTLRVPLSGKPERHLADEAKALLAAAGRPVSCVVFANTPATARAVYTELVARRKSAGDRVLLLTGRAREEDAAVVRSQILDAAHGAPSERPNVAREHSLVVVATQTLEVGADVDFEFLVTEQCGVRALTQRLGRLNRLGRFDGSRAVYVHLESARARKPDTGWPVYGPEPDHVLRRLEQAQSIGDESGNEIDMSPHAISAVLGEAEDDPGRAPEVLPALLWEWVKTTTPPPGEAPVEPYFSGIQDQNRSVSVIWRCHVPVPGERLWPRPRDAEAIDVPIWELRSALEDQQLTRLTPDRLSVEAVGTDELRPGDSVVLPTDVGLIDQFGWDATCRERAHDVALECAGLPLDAAAIRRLASVEVGGLVNTILQNDVDEPDEEESSAALAHLIETLRATLPPKWDEDSWAGFLSALDPVVSEPANEIPRLRRRSEDASRVIYDEFDERSLAAAAVELDAHGYAVGEQAYAVARCIGLAADLAGVLRSAGQCHDVGKADDRFQQWLRDGPVEQPLVAKSSMRRDRWAAARAAAGWPRGGRHEELSARLVTAWLAAADSGDISGSDAQLLTHLVVSHHGRGRPLVEPVNDGSPSSVRWSIKGHEVSACADLAVVDWEQPERFARLNERFGPWGLALLEAVVRQADHTVSAGASIAWEVR
ncbi:type I-U CRISPR-associated helicase/endonuclease Cas3 [Candidatus Poriferisodalis sp.]|uniref:type I-G CRISPR-associated helicase/endonuclease Cas3g n=1 Tax=Candidatus Poriferisodalis sp. TaxID=3101277 RepID=UPI003B0212C1